MSSSFFTHICASSAHFSSRNWNPFSLFIACALASCIVMFECQTMPTFMALSHFTPLHCLWMRLRWLLNFCECRRSLLEGVPLLRIRRRPPTPLPAPDFLYYLFLPVPSEHKSRLPIDVTGFKRSLDPWSQVVAHGLPEERVVSLGFSSAGRSGERGGPAQNVKSRSCCESEWCAGPPPPRVENMSHSCWQLSRRRFERDIAAEGSGLGGAVSSVCASHPPPFSEPWVLGWCWHGSVEANTVRSVSGWKDNSH